MIEGAADFIKALSKRGLNLYAASGTDHEDVIREAEVLGIRQYFRLILGAPPRKRDCSKEAVLRRLLSDDAVNKGGLLVIGDGRVEIELGVKFGALTLGMATDEVRRWGINPRKRSRLIKAGVHAIAGDYTNFPQILEWAGIQMESTCQ
jgi:phosphoglycolate phosphatase-like HAD superfamily hydrolase